MAEIYTSKIKYNHMCGTVCNMYEYAYNKGSINAVWMIRWTRCLFKRYYMYMQDEHN